MRATMGHSVIFHRHNSCILHVLSGLWNYEPQEQNTRITVFGFNPESNMLG